MQFLFSFSQFLCCKKAHTFFFFHLRIPYLFCNLLVFIYYLFLHKLSTSFFFSCRFFYENPYKVMQTYQRLRQKPHWDILQVTIFWSHQWWRQKPHLDILDDTVLWPNCIIASSDNPRPLRNRGQGDRRSRGPNIIRGKTYDKWEGGRGTVPAGGGGWNGVGERPPLLQT